MRLTLVIVPLGLVGDLYGRHINCLSSLRDIAFLSSKGGLLPEAAATEPRAETKTISIK